MLALTFVQGGGNYGVYWDISAERYRGVVSSEPPFAGLPHGFVEIPQTTISAAGTEGARSRAPIDLTKYGAVPAGPEEAPPDPAKFGLVPVNPLDFSDLASYGGAFVDAPQPGSPVATLLDPAEKVDWGEQAKKYGEPRTMPSFTQIPGAKLGREVTMNWSDFPNAKEDDELSKRADAARARRDYASAISLWQHLADLGGASAMFWLGYMYEGGLGFAQSDQQAVTWFRKAAEYGSPTGMYCLGWMYQNGRGVARDDAQAVAWFGKAAAYMPLAMTNLAWMYENGRGVGKDKAESLAWYRKAADLGDESAKASLRRLGQ
jgi:hypothetical protein